MCPGGTIKMMHTHELKKQALNYIKREKYDKAINIYKMLLEKAPSDTSTMLKVAKVYETIGQERLAIKIYSQARDYYYHWEMYHHERPQI